jgi:NADPH-dependent glutamate synthase beta subunit-like oxidoreductase
VPVAVRIPDRRYFEELICCREACPVHTDARGYVQAVARGDYELAYRIARAPNPFASICGRVCGAPCERACRRGAVDQPVAIRAIKRCATERHGVEASSELGATLELSAAAGSVDAAPNGHRVAVVGSGVAGLTAAHDLARLGYQVTVFEAASEPGGMLQAGVPIFRLPREVWRREIDAILSLGVELRCGVSVGSAVTLPELREQGFGAVLLAVGLQRSRMLELPGHEHQGILGGLAMLRDFNAGRALPAMGRVVVVGGGNVAYDCARGARRLPGTTSVDLVCLEALHEMPADEIEVVEGDEEGIARHHRRGPVRFEGDGSRVSGLVTQRAARVFDEHGRFAPELVPGTDETLACDTIILAVGQMGDTGFCAGMEDLQLGRGGTVVADAVTGRTAIPWLFSAGDAALGPKLFIDAIAHAQRAARSIHAHLSGEEQAAATCGAGERRGFVAEQVREGLSPGYLGLARRYPPAAEPARRLQSVDAPVELPFSDHEARRQGSRCLRCEVETIFDGRECVLCGGCADVCPTFCLKLVRLAELGLAEEGAVSAIIKDEQRCIRCGLCVERCPTDAIRMERLCGFEPWTCEEPAAARAVA